jgi:hypothetical protein
LWVDLILYSFDLPRFIVDGLTDGETNPY